MRRIMLIVSAIVIVGVHSQGFAADCVCVDWVNKDGYCVDYIKDKIPSFPIPMDRTEIESLKNKELSEVTAGDVAIFSFRNYWHVAFVENVHRNPNGFASAIDVTEMNFGDQMSFDEFKSAWKSRSEGEWQRAICCGVTDKYDQTGFRKNVALNTVTQIWSPESVEHGGATLQKVRDAVDKVKEVFSRFIDFVDRTL